MNESTKPADEVYVRVKRALEELQQGTDDVAVTQRLERIREEQGEQAYQQELLRCAGLQ